MLKIMLLFVLTTMQLSAFRFNIMNPHSSFALNDFKILIQGTKNAYTSVREYDVLLYKLEAPIKGAPLALGALLSQGSLVPLCNRERGSNEFYIDHTQKPLDAEELKSQSRLLRIVSSDRRGKSCFVIDEYIDNDVHIPLVAENAPIPTHHSETLIAEVDEKLADALQQVVQLSLQRQELSRSDERGVKSRVSATTAPQAIGPYSQAIKANGFMFVSGCIGFNPTSMKLAGETIEAQTIQALENMKAILEAGGSSMEQVCKTTILLKDMATYSIVNKLYASYFHSDTPPARTTFAVADLPANALIEIDATAVYAPTS